MHEKEALLDVKYLCTTKRTRDGAAARGGMGVGVETDLHEIHRKILDVTYCSVDKGEEKTLTKVPITNRSRSQNKSPGGRFCRFQHQT